eukprot:GHVU01194663.1.p2 GENE.GHVU01194663.1~~GHVU01194663.1.p2  ORF type:complete len:117 (+),score=14.02 GHVU01194663.1:237-587(+)
MANKQTDRQNRRRRTMTKAESPPTSLLRGAMYVWDYVAICGRGDTTACMHACWLLLLLLLPVVAGQWCSHAAPTTPLGHWATGPLGWLVGRIQLTDPGDPQVNTKTATSTSRGLRK